jgi:pimeloyl-ACP methyl ester carboxylesterase
MDRFTPRTTWLAGLDRGADLALQLSLREPALCDTVLLVAGAGFAPFPRRKPYEVKQLLGARPNRLPYTIVTFPGAAGPDQPAARLAEAMEQLDFDVRVLPRFEGEYSPSSAAGLIFDWLGGE